MRNEDTELGRLMHDFYCTDPSKMHYKVLADRVRYFKETEEGEKKMCDLLDDMMNKAENKGKKEGMRKGKKEGKIEVAKKLIKEGSLSLDKIAECTGLSIDMIRELAGSKSA